MLPTTTLLALWLGAGPAMAGTPERPRQVTLAVCPDLDTCADELSWLRDLQELDGESILVVDAVLELDSGGWQDGAPALERIHEAIARAREALAAGHHAVVDGALDDVETALQRYTGPLENQILVDLYLLRGASRLARERPGADGAFSQAVAVAWNRQVQLPDDEAVQAAWYAAQEGHLEAGTAMIRIRGGRPGVVCELDGVSLGPSPADVNVFAGRHRLTAADEIMGLEWKEDLRVEPGEVHSVAPSFDRSGDAAWVHQQLLQALQTRNLDPSVGTLLAEWCRRQGIFQLRLARAEPLDSSEERDELHTGERRYRLLDAVFDPNLRAFRGGGSARPAIPDTGLGQEMREDLEPSD